MKAAAYPPTRLASGPISQDSLRHWGRDACEGSYIVNHAARFNRCSSELQEHVYLFPPLPVEQSKYPMNITETLKDLKDYTAFHQNVSVAICTALQHLPDSLLVHLAYLTLL